MPPPADHPSLELRILPETYCVAQLSSESDVPSDIIKKLTEQSTEKIFVSITRTEEELSIVFSVSQLDGYSNHFSNISHWRCIKVKGPMDFGMVGVLNAFTNPLKAAGIPVFAISTWNTDFILVSEGNVDRARNELEKDGWKFSES